MKTALATMRHWSFPDFKGIYCALGFKTLDGSHQTCQIEGIKPANLPAYYEPYRSLPAPEATDPEFEARFKAENEELGRKLKAAADSKRLKSAIADHKHKDTYKPPEWLQ